ncbi:MAG: beta-glucoside-specific PTS transporter subunit IIABC [Lachnospiraceae bacterium]|nr:beta-glucoside-specific PTS transporter subunit IIABC [Lachnospiraceae bacterium]
MYEELVKTILEATGPDNIISATHCFTRLRLQVKDFQAVDEELITKQDKVLQVVKANGQLQIVIGNEVAAVYAELLRQRPDLGEEEASGEGKKNEEEKKGFSVKGILNTIASIFTPTIPAMAGGGVIKGLLVLLTTYGLLSTDSGTYQILTAAADSIFYFMPVILGYTSAKVFGCSIPITMTIGASLIYPDLVSFMSSAETVTFLGIPVVNTTYSSTVIPIILAAYVYSKLEKLLDRVIPDMIKAVVAPLISLIVMVPATLLVFGPFGNYTSNLIGAFFQTITSVSPLLAGAFFGGVYSILVMFGMHRALVPIGINEVATSGSTALWAFTGPANFSQAGAALGVFLRVKDKKMKSVSLSASITALFGITEPALYGVNLKYKRPMIAVVACGALGGAIAGAGGARAYAVAIPSILTLPTFFGEGFAAFMIGILVAFFGAAALTAVLGVDEGPDAPDVGNAELSAGEEPVEDGVVVSPLSGTVIPLSEVKDETFSSGLFGPGCGIIPAEGKLYAPADGELTSVFPTGHALGMRTQDGKELLIHIGIDTVKLDGKYFKSHVNQGDTVKRGDLLVEFDNAAIRKCGYDTTTMVIMTDVEAEQIQVCAEGSVRHGAALIRQDGE